MAASGLGDFCKLGQKLGFIYPFSFTSSQAVFEEYQQMCRLSRDGHLNIYEADYKELTHNHLFGGKIYLKIIGSLPIMEKQTYFL